MVTASPSSGPTVRCWNCEAQTRGQPWCPSCGKLAPRAPGATHFDAFGLKPAVDLDVAALERQYRELSLKLHPDRYAQADARERRLSVEATSALNDAYRTLRDPSRRAFYLLSLHGVDLERDDAGGRRRSLPSEFLEEVLALREELEGADLPRAQALARTIGERMRATLDEAQGALRTVLGGGGEQALAQAADALGRVRYFQRFLEEVAAKEEEAL